MSERPPERVLLGRVASRGMAVAPLALQRSRPIGKRVPGTVAEERTALEAACARARADLETLAEAADGDAAEILEFQIALLGDDDLIGPIFERVTHGDAADAAWRATLDDEIATYRETDDELLAARAADLQDLRDRVLHALVPDGEDGAPVAVGAAAILAAEDLTPSGFLETDWRCFRGAVLRHGSVAGHVALLARARGTPLVVGLGSDFDRLCDGALTVLDAERGAVIVAPAPAARASAEARLAAAEAASRQLRAVAGEPAITAGGERVWVAINVDDPALLDVIDARHSDGVGLTRTEFLFQGGALPDEAQQVAAYTRVLRWADGRPVIVRTLDAGGDKPIPGLTPVGETDPFLGLRGLRLSLARPDVFRVQLRALARVAALGRLKVMAPMVTVPAELDAVRRLFEEVVAELAAAGIEAARPPLGMMVEVPAAALTAAGFDADFYSIGSNDLVQYLTATSRDNPAVAGLYDPGNAAVLELIGRVVAAGRARGVEVSLCGDMASDPALLPRLLDLGVRRLSVAPAALGPVKAAIAGWRPAPTGGRFEQDA